MVKLEKKGLVEEEEMREERMRRRRRRTEQESLRQCRILEDGGKGGRMETSLHRSQHVELHCVTATVTRSDAQWNVETWHSSGP